MNQVKEFFEYIFNSFKFLVIVQPWEKGIRVRSGKTIKKLNPGIFFKIPYVDSVYVQEVRLRVSTLPIQTLTGKDSKSLTINSALGYSITDIEKLYNTLFHPEATVQNIAMASVSEYISKSEVSKINVSDLEIYVLKELNRSDYGLKFEYFKITNFAVARAFRLIQDGQSWVDNTLKMNDKK